jgi:hypothetical protein
MDESAKRVATYKSEQPQDQQDYKNGPEHMRYLHDDLLAVYLDNRRFDARPTVDGCLPKEYYKAIWQ